LIEKMVTIRLAQLIDVGAITAIYNDAILKTVATFDTEPKTLAEVKQWFTDHDSKYPLLVAEQGGYVIGWASLSEWSDRCAYSDTAEVSIYVHEEHRGKGVGRQLLKAVLHEGKTQSLHTVIARITEGNEHSIRLLESAGFQHVGTMREVGRKFNKLLDVHLMQIIYDG
jgi:phosphinothricin acetyltransferase